MKITILRADGSESEIDDDSPDLCALIGAKTLDFVNLRDGRVMAVDDIGYVKNLPVNEKATKLYHGICRPGTTHQIVGDVALFVDCEW